MRSGAEAGRLGATARSGPADAAPGSFLSAHRRRWLAGYLFVAPAVLGLAVFVLAPLAVGMWTSLHTGFLTNLRFVGLRNYEKVLTDDRFWESLGTTVVFTLSYTSLSLVIGFVAASWLVREGLRFRRGFSALLVLPFVVTPAVAALVWQYMFDERFGVINYLLDLAGLPGVPWLKTPALAMLSLVVVETWFSVGYYTILLGSGMQSIPKDYYEAAEIAGAGVLAKARHITLPLLVPTLVFVLIISLLGGFVNSFVLAQIITGGGPFRSTEVLMLFIYTTAFEKFDIPLANALTVVMFTILLTLALALKRWQDRVYKGLH